MVGKYNEEIEGYGFYCNEKIERTTDKHTIFDCYGYKYIGCIDRFRFCKNKSNKKYNPYKIHKNNPYTIENISTFLKLNYSGIRLLGNQKYTGEFDALYLQCEKHGIIKSNWGYISNLNCGICKKCGLEKQSASSRKNSNDTISDFIKVHGDRYDYSLVESTLTKSTEPVSIICKLHGEFKMTPNNHLNGQNCYKCSNKEIGKWNMKSKEKAISDLIDKYGDEYDYSMVEYNGSNNDIYVICKKHGIFQINYGKHLYGQRCKKCSEEDRYNRGWSKKEWKKIGENSKYFTGYKTYVLKCWDEFECFYKIGITFNDIEVRFASVNMPYNYEILFLKNFGEDHESAWTLENNLHNINKNNKYKPMKKFNGYARECFSSVDINIEIVLN